MAQLTSEVLAACINLGADTQTTLRLVRRASSFLHELAALYRACEDQRLDALLQEWNANSQDDTATVAIEAPN
jgi:hypothetical protein